MLSSSVKECDQVVKPNSEMELGVAGDSIYKVVLPSSKRPAPPPGLVVK